LIESPELLVMRKILLVLLLLFSAAAAEKPIPESVVIEGKTYVLNAFLWRDFMPSTDGEGGSPMMASVQLTAGDEALAGLNWKSMRVLENGKEVWNTKLESRENEAAAYNGPKLGIGSKVDVIVQFQNPQGENVVIQTKNASVNRTS
jgi:hypothetical protein